MQLLWTQFHSASFSCCETLKLVRLLLSRDQHDDALSCLSIAAEYYLEENARFTVPLSQPVRLALVAMCNRNIAVDADVIDLAYMQVLKTLLDIRLNLMGPSHLSSDDDSA